jgi:farnesyl diphosphate synthase
MTFVQRLGAAAGLIEGRLAELLAECGPDKGSRLAAAMTHALLGGGKRFRPFLVIESAALFGVEASTARDAAAAFECVHCYSLAHDDLPCMDNDDFRRGQPSSHRRFGEAVAVLAGDALLTLAFEILTTLEERHRVAPDVCLGAASVLARSSGTAGLISGQAMDLTPPAPRDEAVVDAIHLRKTAQLIAASMEVGAILAGAGIAERDGVRKAGLEAGLAFQITDDVLDIEGAQETLGKTPGKDVQEGKLTLPSIIGVEASRRRARGHLEVALAGLPGAKGAPLETLVRHIVERSR